MHRPSSVAAAFATILLGCGPGLGTSGSSETETQTQTSAETETSDDEGQSQPHPYSGAYFLGMETILGPSLPILWIAELEVEEPVEDEAGSAMIVTLQLLDYGLLTPIGEPFIFDEVLLIDDGFQVAGLITVLGAGNPATGGDLELDIVLDAHVQGPNFCGVITGMALSPLALDLEGSNFAAIEAPITTPAGLPAPVWACDQLP